MENDGDQIQYEIFSIETLDGDIDDTTVPTTTKVFYYPPPACTSHHHHKNHRTAPILHQQTTPYHHKNNSPQLNCGTFRYHRCCSSRKSKQNTNVGVFSNDQSGLNINRCNVPMDNNRWTTNHQKQHFNEDQQEEEEESSTTIDEEEEEDSEDQDYSANNNSSQTLITNNNNNNQTNHDQEDNQKAKIDLLALIKIKKKITNDNNKNLEEEEEENSKCSTMAFSKPSNHQQMPNGRTSDHNLFILNLVSKKILFPVILLLSIIALVLLHNGSLNTRKTPTPKKFFTSNNPFITEFEFGQLKELWARLVQNEISFIMFYAPWDSDCIRARNEIEVVANHYGQQIFFGAINCWWPDGECKKYQTIKRFPHFVAHIHSEGEIEYKGPVLASYIIPFLENVMNPLIPVQNEGELLDLRAQHDAVVLGYFNFNQSPNQPGYRSYLTTAIKALTNDPWRTVVYTVVTNSRTALKLKIDPHIDSSLVIYVGNISEHFTAKFSKPFTLLSWIYSRSELANTIKWMNPSGVKSTMIADYIRKAPTFILFTPRSFLLGISPYYDLLREIVLDYYNCDNSPIIRSLIHRNILRRRLLEERLAELEEKCHELLDKDVSHEDDKSNKKFSDNIDTCCHTQTVKWRSFGGVRHGMSKKCLCTSCVHISLPKCPAKCSHFDCLSTASRYLDEFDPNYVNNTAVYCNQIKNSYQPKYTPYYKIVTTCSGNLQESHSDELWGKENVLATDEKISRMIQEFEIQHCRKLKLGMNYTDLNFPETSENRKSNLRANFTGLACRTNRTLKFMAFDSLLYQAFAESLGIDVFNVPHSTIALIIDPSKESVHVLNHEILFDDLKMDDKNDDNDRLDIPKNSYSKNSFIEFIKNYTDGTLPRFLRNQLSSGICDLKQMISQDRNRSVICVPELNTVTFVNLILGKSLEHHPSSITKTSNIKNQVMMDASKFIEKDIVVMYYAPWCGFCSSVAHIFLDIARLFAFSDDIIFARINGDANDLPWEYTVDRYPTVIFFPNRKRSNSVTYPPNKLIDKLGLYDFIMKYAQLSVKLQMAVARCQHLCLKRSMISNYHHRRTTTRLINHFMKSLILCKDRRRELKTKTGAGAKELKKLDRHLSHLIQTLKHLKKEQRKQNLLSQFILMKIKHYIQLDFNYAKFNRELYSLLAVNPKTTKNQKKTDLKIKPISKTTSGQIERIKQQQKEKIPTKELPKTQPKIVKLNANKRKDEL